MKLIYTPHKDWQGTLNFSELRHALKVRNLKYSYEKYEDWDGIKYEITFDEKDKEKVLTAYNVLINICDLEIG